MLSCITSRLPSLWLNFMILFPLSFFDSKTKVNIVCRFNNQSSQFICLGYQMTTGLPESSKTTNYPSSLLGKMKHLILHLRAWELKSGFLSSVKPPRRKLWHHSPCSTSSVTPLKMVRFWKFFRQFSAFMLSCPTMYHTRVFENFFNIFQFLVAYL